MDANQTTESDRELLQRFATDGAEEAFRGMVDRHAAMVRGVALRCTGDGAAADEVAQSVFFLLARRADSLRGEHLAGWLHRAAFLTARNVRRNALRYKQALQELGQQHEVMTDASNTDSRNGSPWEQVHPYLDEAVARLPEAARGPVMMRYFESRSVREIASRTGKSEAAVRKVLERALHRLSALLRRRGVATNGVALGVMLSAHSLLAPPASAAVLAARALSASNIAAAAAGPPFPMSAPGGVPGSPFLKGAGVALLLAAVPLALIWRQNTLLRRDSGEPRDSTSRVDMPPRIRPVQLSSSMPGPAVAAETRTNGKAGGDNKNTALKEKSAKEAARELARMNLYLPGLTEEQKARILALYEEQGTRRGEAFEKARQSGAFTRLAGGIANLTEEDKALFRAAHTGAGGSLPEDDALKAILTPAQFGLHLEAAERRRVNEAEGVASDALRSLGRNLDLSLAQRDAIFQEVAQFELNPPEEEEGSEATLPSPFREEGRDRIIRGHLSEEQAALFDQRREDDRRRREQFLQSMQPPR